MCEPLIACASHRVLCLRRSVIDHHVDQYHFRCESEVSEAATQSGCQLPARADGAHRVRLRADAGSKQQNEGCEP